MIGCGLRTSLATVRGFENMLVQCSLTWVYSLGTIYTFYSDSFYFGDILQLQWLSGEIHIKKCWDNKL